MRKVLKITWQLIFAVFILQAMAWGDLTPKRKRIVNVIDMELKELSRLSRVSGNKDPEMLLRIAELYLERGRILREQENEDFFELPVEKRKKINRKKFYSGSKKYIKKAQETGYYILKKFKSFKEKGDVYYILAFNEKENVNYSAAKKLFEKSIQVSRNKRSGSGVKSRLSLADIYYGEGNFKKSKQYYDAVINYIKDDRWYTKYLYNLAWCNFRLGSKSLGIRQMQKVHSLSRSSKYVDKSLGASRDLGFFYADSGNLKQAKSFYNKVGGNVAKNFYDMGLFLKDKQKYSKSLSMFISAYAAGDNTYKVKSLIEILSIYDKYGNNKNFVKYARKTKELSLKKDDRKELLFFISKRAVVLQKDLGQSHNRTRPEILKEKGSYAAELYFIAQELDPSLKERSLFYAAESFYSSNQYAPALKFYDEVREIGNVKDKYFKRSIIGMLTTINEPNLPNSLRRKYFESVYINYVKIETDPNKKRKAVEKLFKYLIDEKKDPRSSENVFFKFASVFPQMIGKNEAMIGRIVDLYKKEKDKKSLFAFVNKLKTLQLPLTDKFVKRLQKIVLTTQFDSVQKANKKGDKMYALKGYILIYKDKDSTVAARRNAAYNIAVLFYELGNMNLMHRWLDRALSEMTSAEVSEYTDSFSLMVKELYLRQRYNEGASLTEKLLGKVCRYKAKSKDDLLGNYIVMKLSENKDSAAVNFYNSQLKCNINKNSQIFGVESFIDFYVETNQISTAKNFFTKYKRLTTNKYDEIRYLGKILAKKRSLGIKASRDEERELSRTYRSLKSKSKISIDAIDEYAYLSLKSVEREITKFERVQLKFPQNTFNKTLQSQFKALDRITQKLIAVLKVGSGRAMVKSYYSLIDSYAGFADKIENFEPAGKSKEYVASFKKSMEGIVAPLRQKVRQFEQELHVQVSNNNVLSIEYGMRERSKIPFAPEFEYVIMDKRGM